MVCGLRFEDDMGTEVIYGGEYDFWDEERGETIFGVVLCHKCRPSDVNVGEGKQNE